MSKIIFAQSKNLKPPLRRFQYILYCSIPIKMSSTNWNTTNIGYFLWLSRFMFFVVERLYGPYKRWIICSQTNRGMRYKFQIDFRLLVWSLWRHVFVRNIKNPNSFLKKFFFIDEKDSDFASQYSITAIRYRWYWNSTCNFLFSAGIDLSYVKIMYWVYVSK